MNKEAKQNNEKFDIYFGAMNVNKDGNLEMPPEYSHQMKFNGASCIAIPLENNKTKTLKESEKSIDK